MAKNTKSYPNIDVRLFAVDDAGNLIPGTTADANWLLVTPKEGFNNRVVTYGTPDGNGGMNNIDEAKMMLGRVTAYLHTHVHQPSASRFNIVHETKFDKTIDGATAVRDGDAIAIEFVNGEWITTFQMGLDGEYRRPSPEAQARYWSLIRALKLGAGVQIWVAPLRGALLDYYLELWTLEPEEMKARSEQHQEAARINTVTYQVAQEMGVAPKVTASVKGKELKFKTTDGRVVNMYDFEDGRVFPLSKKENGAFVASPNIDVLEWQSEDPTQIGWWLQFKDHLYIEVTE